MSIFYSCKTEKEEVEVVGNEYFPLKIGAIKIYQVDSFIHDPFADSTRTISREVKEEIVEQFLDNENDTAYRVEYSYYDKNQFKWRVFLSFSRKIKDNYIIEKLDNQKEVKLLTPISTYKTKGTTYSWNLNMYNNRDPENVKYSKVFYTHILDNKPYENCVNVQLTKPTNNLIIRFREEVYAKNIGLIYKRIDQSDFLNSSNTDSLNRKSGYEVIFRLK